MSFYNYTDFLEACSRGTNVIVWESAKDGALKDFGIFGGDELLRFISSGGLERKVFQDSKPWDKNPNPSDPIIIDAYRFLSLKKIGYLAFFFNHNLGKWNLKSFKLSYERDGSISLTLNQIGGLI